MVFFTHAGLSILALGRKAFADKREKANSLKYLDWVNGEKAHTHGEVITLTKVGYVFPKNMKAKDSKDKMTHKSDADFLFCQADFPAFQLGRVEGWEVGPITVDSE